jgi:hypothetical protein
MNKNLHRSVRILSLALFASFGSAAIAEVRFDAETGTGFVGKGDVQLVFGWNNRALQDNVDAVEFQAKSITETTWSCTNENNDNIQQRTRTTTTEGVVSSVARERNQITGFILTGYDGGATTETEGPKMNSCPSGPWVFNNDTETTDLPGGSLQVSIDGANWFAL